MPKLSTGEKIKHARKARRWSRATLSKVSGVHEQTIIKWEQGKTEPRWLYRRLMEKVLEIDLEPDSKGPEPVTFDITIAIEGEEDGKEK